MLLVVVNLIHSLHIYIFVPREVVQVIHLFPHYIIKFIFVLLCTIQWITFGFDDNRNHEIIRIHLMFIFLYNFLCVFFVFLLFSYFLFNE